MKRKAAARHSVEERIEHRFTDPDLLTRALTHRSAVSGNPGLSYQRLEFLGDRVLGLAVAEMLVRNFPKASEGELSRRLSDLVRSESCATVARAMQLDGAVQLGAVRSRKTELTDTILGDVCEAVVGAVFLDAGYAVAADLVMRFWKDQMLAPARPLRDPKTMLQEWAQGQGLPTPSYHEVERRGPHHDPQFRVSVDLPDKAPTEGTGGSKRAAEQAAAAAMLEREGVKLKHG